jgi:hypothetical protein
MAELVIKEIRNNRIFMFTSVVRNEQLEWGGGAGFRSPTTGERDTDNAAGRNRGPRW